MLRDHLAERLEGMPRYRQKLAPVPLGLHEPVWVDDPRFDPAEHLLHAEGADLDAIVDGILSTPLPRDRPLWQMWIADELPDDGVALIGKMHHCMVDGAAIAELGRLILDAAPDAEPPAGPEMDGRRPRRRQRARGWRAARSTAPPTARGSCSPRRGSPRRRAGSATFPGSPARWRTPCSRRRRARSLNAAGAAARRHVRVSRSLDDLRAARRRFGVSPNDVVLAACAGGLRRFAERRGERPQRLKVMVPADVRAAEDDAGAGNRISFVFLELPCDEPDAAGPPGGDPRRHGAAAARRRRGGPGRRVRPDRADAVAGPARARPRVRAPARCPTSRSRASPGPPCRATCTGAGCARCTRPCRSPRATPLSIGVVTVAGRVCLGLFADAQTLPDADELGEDVGAAFDELLAAAA